MMEFEYKEFGDRLMEYWTYGEWQITTNYVLQSIDEKYKYNVYKNGKPVAEFETLEEAKEYCKEKDHEIHTEI